GDHPHGRIRQDVSRDVVDEYEEQRQPAKEIEPQVALDPHGPVGADGPAPRQGPQPVRDFPDRHRGLLRCGAPSPDRHYRAKFGWIKGPDRPPRGAAAPRVGGFSTSATLQCRADPFDVEALSDPPSPGGQGYRI